MLTFCLTQHKLVFIHELSWHYGYNNNNSRHHYHHPRNLKYSLLAVNKMSCILKVVLDWYSGLSYNSSDSFSTANPNSVLDSFPCTSVQTCEQKQPEKVVRDLSPVLYLTDITALRISISIRKADSRFDISEA